MTPPQVRAPSGFPAVSALRRLLPGFARARAHPGCREGSRQAHEARQACYRKQTRQACYRKQTGIPGFSRVSTSLTVATPVLTRAAAPCRPAADGFASSDLAVGYEPEARPHAAQPVVTSALGLAPSCTSSSNIDFGLVHSHVQPPGRAAPACIRRGRCCSCRRNDAGDTAALALCGGEVREPGHGAARAWSSSPSTRRSSGRPAQGLRTCSMPLNSYRRNGPSGCGQE